MNYSPKFSVIIPTYHRNDLLEKCLDCLAPKIQTLAASQYEIIVTDDGRETTAEQMIRDRYPWVKWVAGLSKGPAANRNNGVKYAQGEWLVFTDDDCLPDAQWLTAYAEAIIDNSNNYSVFEGRVYVDRPRKTLAEKSPTNDTGGYLWSCNFAIDSQIFRSLGGFDERFPYAAMEDVDFKFRLAKAGILFFFIHPASVCHPWRPSGGWLELKKHQQSTLVYLSLHPEEATRINSLYYLKLALQSLIKTTLPQGLNLKGRGIGTPLLELVSFLQMVFILSRNPQQ